MANTERRLSGQTGISGPKPHPAGVVLRTVLLALAYSAAIAWALWMFVTRPGMDWYSRARFGDSIYSRCERPFVARVLLPWTVQAITAVTPAATRHYLASAIRGLISHEPRLSYASDCGFEFGVTIFLLLACLVAFACVLRVLARRFVSAPGRVEGVIPVCALLLLPVMYTYMNYVYDLPTLLLFTLALALIAARSRWFYLVYILAVLNKETAILLSIPWFLENRRELASRSLVSGLALQFGIWLVIRGVITYLYRNTPGVMFEWWHWQRNLNVLARMVRAPFDGSFAMYFRRHWYKTIALAAVPALLLSLKSSPPFLRRALLMAVPIFVLSLVGGFFDELRTYYEVYAVVVLILASGLATLVRPRPKSAAV